MKRTVINNIFKTKNAWFNAVHLSCSKTLQYKNKHEMVGHTFF